MGRRKRNVEEAVSSMSSMIDVVFLLLIYFVVTQKPIIEDVHLGCDLPAPDAPPQDEPPPPPMKLEVPYDDRDRSLLFPAKGEKPDTDTIRFRIDGWSKSTAELRQRLLGISSDTTIVISVDPNSHHGKLVFLLDLLDSMNFKKLNIIDDMQKAFHPERKD